MAVGATLKEIRDQALDSADMSDGFSVEKQTNLYINKALAHLHRLVCDTNEDFVVEKFSISATSGTEEYALPEGMYKLYKVFVLDGSERHVVDKYEHREVGDYSSSNITATMQLFYAPAFKRLEADDQTVHWALPDGYDDYAALSAAIRLKVKEESDASQLMALQQQCLQEIMDSVSPRDLGEPGRIEDHYQRWSGRTWDIDPYHNIVYRLRGQNISFLSSIFKGA